MSFILEPNNKNCLELGIANGTWGYMVIGSGIADYLGIKEVTNDPITVTAEQAAECRKLIAAWTPYDGWGGGINNNTMKEYFDVFFRDCGGFTTR